MFQGSTLRGCLAALMLLVLPQLALAQTTTFVPSTQVFPHIAFGGDSAGAHYITVIQIVNNNSVATTGHFDLLSDTGTALTALVDEQDLSSFDVSLTPGETRQIIVRSNGPVASGWMRAIYTPSPALTAVLIQSRNGFSINSEVGIDAAFTAIANTDIVFENDASLNNGVAVSNPSSANQFILARLWNPTTGAQETNGASVIFLPPGGHLARFVTELFPNVPTVGQERAELTLDSCSNQFCNTAGGNGFVATVLRVNGNQLTSIAVAARGANNKQTYILPQVAFGGQVTGQNMKTVLYFTTDETNGVAGTIELFDNDGNPLTASADGGSPTSAVVFTVPSNRVTRIVLSGDSTLRSGWARVTLPSTLNLTINAVFQTFNSATLVSEASVLESPSVQRGLIFVKLQSNLNVGVAFANSSTNANTVSLDLFDQQGAIVARHDVALPPNGHLARFVTELFPEVVGLTDFSGSMALHSAGTFSALALRLTGDKIATVPIAADGMHRPAISALRLTGTVRNPAQVFFSVDLSDLDSDISTNSSLPVLAAGVLAFSSGDGVGGISMDGTAILNASGGTLNGTFQPSNVNGAVPAGTQAIFYLRVFDALGNQSNVVSVPVTF
jgi:hypothetical protein